MSIRRDFLLILIILLIFLIKPTGFWRELKLLWARREQLLRVLLVAVVLYFLYGIYSLYSLYNQGLFTR